MAITETAWVGGQQEDFDSLFLAHWPEIHRLLYRMLGDEAEDAGQDVFLTLYLKPPPPGSNYRAWLYKVASREGLNRLRSRRRREGLLGKMRSLWSTEPDAGPEYAAEERDEQRAVRDVLARMRLLYAQVLMLRHEGLGYAELAVVVGVSKGSVGTLLVRAERQFAELWGESGGKA